MHRSRHLDDAALLLRSPRLSVLLDDVDSFDQHAAGLGIDAHDLSFLSLIVTAHHANRVALRHVELETLGVHSVTRTRPLLCRLSVLQIPHATKPPVRGRRSSCTSSRGARAP